MRVDCEVVTERPPARPKRSAKGIVSIGKRKREGEIEREKEKEREGERDLGYQTLLCQNHHVSGEVSIFTAEERVVRTRFI